MFKLFNRITHWRTYKDLDLHWTDLHMLTIRDYFSDHSKKCHFQELPSAKLLNKFNWWKWDLDLVGSFTEELKVIFMVPMLRRFYQNQNRINKCQLIEAFLSFLLQLLYHKSYLVPNQIEDLEMGLRYLLTILGDMSWMLLGCQSDEFKNLLADFEAVGNEAGCLVHSLLFSTDVEMDERISAVLNHIDLLKATLQSSDIATLAYTTPRTSMVNSFLILDSLVGDLEDLLKREDSGIADLQDQINHLHQGVVLLHSSINDIGELKEPLMQIGDIAHQAQYLITAFLVKDAPLWYVITRLTYLNSLIDSIRMELQVISVEKKFGALKVTALPLHDEKENETKDIMVGLEEKTTTILDQLVGGGREMQTILIFGMPGIGKTTLAKKLYNHPLVSYRFDKFSWCVISQAYERRSILANILISINSELGKDMILKMEEEMLVVHIHKTLKGRRYLVVMDDVWDSNVWYELQRCFPEDGNGSRILLTSRIKDVAPPNSITHELPFLTDEQCWELLEKKVFGSRTYPPNLQEVGKKIAAKCCGLPLTVVIIAGVLSTVYKEKSAWEEVRGSLASYIDGEENSGMRILELSYNHLPDYLKLCFLYFGRYEEDQQISVAELKRFWIAEGFIGGDKEKSRENIAEEYLMELINRSLVIVGKRRSNGRGVKSCILHDLLRDLCLKKCKEESFLNNWNSSLRSVFDQGHCIRALGNSATSSLCQHVRSFYGGRRETSFYVRDMRLLRVLHFSYISNGVCLYGIEYLVNLRYLIIGEMPTWIEKLPNLEYLSVMSSMRVHLPPTIMKLKKLIHLDSYFAEYDKHWDGSETNNLQFLSLINVKKLKDEELLKCSPNLHKLKCCYELKVQNLEKEEHPHFDLQFLTQLHSLSLEFNTYRGFKLEGFGFPTTIRKLTLSQSRLCWEKMSLMGRLENLEVLKLRTNSFVGERWDTRDGEFQNLRFLLMEDIDLCEWNMGSNERFPKLQRLKLISCYNLQEIPSEIGEITTLE